MEKFMKFLNEKLTPLANFFGRQRHLLAMQRGFMAMDISFIELSSAAMRLESILPHRRQRWTMAHSPPLRTQTATGSINPPQADALSPGPSSTCRLQRQFGQWLRWVLPAPSGTTPRPQFLQVITSLQACVL